MRAKYIPTLLVAAICILVGCMGVGGSTGGTTGGTTTGSSTGGTTGGSTTGGTTGGGGAIVNVSMVSMTFSPQTITAHAGDTIQWTNMSNLPHTVSSDTGQAGLDSSGQFPSGIPPTSVFTWPVPGGATVGTHFFYHCNFHGAAGNGTSLGPGMSGEITVN